MWLQFGWKKSQKRQTDGGSSDSGEKPSARMPEPTMSPKSLRPARRTRKPLKIDNPYDDANRQMTMPAPEPSAQQAPLQSPFATPPDSEDEKEPEVRAPSSGRGRGGRRGGACPSVPAPHLVEGQDVFADQSAMLQECAIATCLRECWLRWEVLAWRTMLMMRQLLSWVPAGQPIAAGGGGAAGAGRTTAQRSRRPRWPMAPRRRTPAAARACTTPAAGCSPRWRSAPCAR